MKIRLALTVLAGCAAALAGCSSTDNVSYNAITWNLTPELHGMSERGVDANRHLATTNNANVRMFFDDVGRTFYTDHPSRLSPMPVVYTSGNPR